MKRFSLSKILCAALLSLFAIAASADLTVTYFHNDLTGSPVAATDENGDVIWRKHYTPYGEVSGKDQDNRVGYTGHQEEANGLVYAGARYYDPALGRFLSTDPVGFVESNSMSFNRYAYANNNPYKFVDPSGKTPETIWDAGNVAIGVASFAANAAAGNYGGAAIDAVGVVIDAAATATPVVPGGAGSIIKAARGAEKVAKETGSYTIEFANGMKYHGKGPLSRAEKSAGDKAADNGTGIANIDWAKSGSNREAFKDEARRIRADGGALNPNNYNKINSPGEKYLRQDGQ